MVLNQRGYQNFTYFGKNMVINKFFNATIIAISVQLIVFPTSVLGSDGILKLPKRDWINLKDGWVESVSLENNLNLSTKPLAVRSFKNDAVNFEMYITYSEPHIFGMTRQLCRSELTATHFLGGEFLEFLMRTYQIVGYVKDGKCSINKKNYKTGNHISAAQNFDDSLLEKIILDIPNLIERFNRAVGEEIISCPEMKHINKVSIARVFDEETRLYVQRGYMVLYNSNNDFGARLHLLSDSNELILLECEGGMFD